MKETATVNYTMLNAHSTVLYTDGMF